MGKMPQCVYDIQLIQGLWGVFLNGHERNEEEFSHMLWKEAPVQFLVHKFFIRAL